MRRVACYAAESTVTSADEPIVALQSLMPIVESWLKSKGEEALAAGLTEFKLPDGRAAVVQAQCYSTATATEWDISVEEPRPVPYVSPVEFEERWTGGYIFENEWQSFRTRQNRALEWVTAPHAYERPSRYTVAVKVIEILGNDTMTLAPVNVGN